MSVKLTVKYGNNILVNKRVESADEIIVTYDNNTIARLTAGADEIFTTANTFSPSDLVFGSRVIPIKHKYLNNNFECIVENGWDNPVQSDDELTVPQAYSATQSTTILEVV